MSTTQTPSSAKIASIANRFGFARETLQAWLADPRYTQDQVAYMLGTKPQDFANLLAAPVASATPTNTTND